MRHLVLHTLLANHEAGFVVLARAATAAAEPYVLKVLRKDARPEHLRRLRMEARYLSLLDLHGVPRTLGIHKIGHRIALINRYVPGHELAHLVAGGRTLPDRVVGDVALQVARVLRDLQQAPSVLTGRPLGLVHRDIKPSNLVLRRDGRVVVLDFGIAATVDDLADDRARGEVLHFTPGYAAPEAWLQHAQGPATDVWALGVTAVRLARGQKVFGPLDTVQQVALFADRSRYEAFVDRRIGELDLEGPIVPLLRRTLAWDPVERVSAAELAEHLPDIVASTEGPSTAGWAHDTPVRERKPLPPEQRREVTAEPLTT